MHRLLVMAAVALVAAMPVAASDEAATVRVTRVSGPSPFPAGGCGQVDPTLDPATGLPALVDEHDEEADLSVAVDPTNPANIVAAWAQDAARGIVVGVSHDGGGTWTTAPVPGLTVCTGAEAQHMLHPRLSWGGDGRLYLAGEMLDGFFPDPRSGLNPLPVVTSTDGGHTWSAPSFVNTLDAMNGFNTIAASPDVPGRAAVAWHQLEPVATSFVAVTSDGGATWTSHEVPSYAPDALPSSRVLLGPGGRIALIQSEGTLRELAAATGAPLTVRTSDDGGATWSPAVVLATIADIQWPMGAIDDDGRIVVAWLTTDASGARSVLVSRSSDGTTWTTPVTAVADVDGPGVTMAIDATGTLGIGHRVDGVGSMRMALATSPDGSTWTSSWLTDPFPAPGYTGYYHETAGLPDGFAVVFLEGDAPGGAGPHDVFVATSRRAVAP